MLAIADKFCRAIDGVKGGFMWAVGVGFVAKKFIKIITKWQV